MLVPLSWLKDYVEVTLDPKTLGERLTEVGLGCEKIIEQDGDVIFDLEITPNRPDLLSIIGVSREVAAIEHKKIQYPKLKTTLEHKRVKNTLPLTITPDYAIKPRFSGIIIEGITVKESPEWLKDRLVKIGQRPINNIVDITNYVMFELGNPLHAFDYERIGGLQMTIQLSKGGENFTSVDGMKYTLPKDAVIVRDSDEVIDLCGIKGGYNSGTYEDTKILFVWAPVEDPVRIRKTSQALGLRSEASSIFERGVNAGGTIHALKRAVDLIQELAGGEIASNLYDMKEKDVKPWHVTLNLDRLSFILGIKIPDKEVAEILERLNLSPRQIGNTIETTIPTYRNDLHIEEDLIEEVARSYGYNNFPKTLPIGEIPSKPMPYFKDYHLDEKIKQILVAAGFSEIYSYSLISEKDLEENGIRSEEILRSDNPVSKEFEYLRPTLKSNLRKAIRQNKPFSKDLNFFELGKVYTGKSLDAYAETYMLSGISTKKNFYEVKGILERIYQTLGITGNPGEYIDIIDEGIFFELPYAELVTQTTQEKVFIPLPKYPPIIEDLALIVPDDIQTGTVIQEIKSQTPLIADVSLLDQYQNTKTFHIIYQDPEKNLTGEEVGKIREKILQHLKQKLHISLKTS